MIGVQSSSLVNSGLTGDNQDTWYQEASAFITKIENDFYPVHGQYRVTNAANGLGFLIHEKGFTAYNLTGQNQTTKWTVEFQLNNIARSQPVFQFVNGEFTKNDEFLFHEFDFGKVEYANDKKGMRQNFIISKKPAGTGNVRVEMKISSSLQRSIVNGGKLVFFNVDNSEINLSYEDLNVWDAEKRTLNSHMELSEDGTIFNIVVDDKNAVYPITIDPLNTSPEWTAGRAPSFIYQ
jgi:hypothetical protein